jgi:hypothetical protein
MNGKTVAVILLFIGIAIAPNINPSVVTASQRNDLVEVTTQACGIKGFGDTTVKLTEEQYQDFKQYLSILRSGLNQTLTAEETVSLINDAVVQLGAYGLLPSGLDIQQVQRLVTGRYQIPFSTNLYTARLRNSGLGNNSNFFCLIAGETSVTRLHSYVETVCSSLIYVFFGLYILSHIIVDNPVVFMNMIYRLQAVSDVFHEINSIRIIGTGMIAFGNCHDTGGHIPPFYDVVPAEGWITTQGILGKKSWDGSLYGRLFSLLTFDSSETIYYIGALGFLGIKLNINGQLFFLGSAVSVRLDE